MLWTGVLSWSDITNNKAAWNTFVWLATLVALADGLSSTGFIAWLGKEGGALMSGICRGMATIVLLLAFYLLHYFVCQHHRAHHRAAAGHADHCLDYPGNEYGSVCPADGHLAGRDGDRSPRTVLAQAQSTTAAATCRPEDYWRLGTIFGAIFLAALLLIGYPWMSMMF